ncbi:DNA recombination protein RmuC [Planctomycetota bacterium]
MEYLLAFVIGAICTGALAYLLSHRKTKQLEDEIRAESERRIVAEEKSSRIPELESAIEQKENENSQIREERTSLRTRLDEQQKSWEEKQNLLNEAKEKLSDAFKALSAEALKNSNTQFLKLAEENLGKFQEGARGDLEKRKQAVDELIKPLKESLKNVDGALKQIGKDHSGVREKIESLLTSEAQLKKETANLVTALKKPTVRGRWGEMQLRRVVEIAGMVKYCDFLEQQSTDSDAGRTRPDMIVRLPGNRTVVVDSKAPLMSYLESLETTDEQIRIERLRKHAGLVRTHIRNLAAKGYWEQFQPTPEFVVMFLPGEMFFSAALEQDPSLIELGVDNRVILATPTTLIALLHAVAYGWQQEQIARNAQEISDLGKVLYSRLCTFVEHFGNLKKGLDRAVESYNKAVGSMERSVLVPARKFKELGSASGQDIDTLEPIDKATRMIQAPETDDGSNDITSEGEDQESPVEPGAK